MISKPFDILNQTITDCEACPRLREHCINTANTKRRSFMDWDYWGKPVPNFGNAEASLLIVGLAPAAHGANRTGRMFTGDRSGDFLFDAMHRTGFANQATGTHQGDGLELINTTITAAAHCAPPQNKPTTQELKNCENYLDQTIDLMPNLQCFLALGQLGFNAISKAYRRRGWDKQIGKKPPFSHGLLHQFEGLPAIACSYHPSQQNTFTGKLTMNMLCDVFNQVSNLLASD